MPRLIFSDEEKRDMIAVYFYCRRNTTSASAEYFRLYPERPQPHRTIFRRLEMALKEKGAFRTAKRGGPSRMNEENETVVLAHVFQTPSTSIRETHSLCAVSVGSIHRVRKKRTR